MKFLIALSVLASTSAFAFDDGSRYIKCYETPQQTGRQDVVYKFETNDERIRLIYPERVRLSQDSSGCLGGGNDTLGGFRACLGEGQVIRGLVPVEVENGAIATVYCQPTVIPWLTPVTPTAE